MRSRDFCFWLQGHFELTGADVGPLELPEGTHVYRNNGLTGPQVEYVRRHLQLVFTHEAQGTTSVARDFCLFLQGLLTFASGDLATAQIAGIKERLHNVFVHEIDPSMGGPEHQAKLNELHVTGPKIGGVSPSGALLRC